MSRRLGTGHLTMIGRLLAALTMVAVVTACGASTSSTSSGSGGTSTSGSAVVIGTASGSPGTYLTDGSGRSLYLFASDTGSASTCMAACASAWPPVTSAGAPAVSGAATAGLLGSLTRADGTHQVTYAGHPLYYFAGDSGPGQTNGQGLTSFGARWWLVAPAGSAITGAATSPPASSHGY